MPLLEYKITGDWRRLDILEQNRVGADMGMRAVTDHKIGAGLRQREIAELEPVAAEIYAVTLGMMEVGDHIVPDVAADGVAEDELIGARATGHRIVAVGAFDDVVAGSASQLMIARGRRPGR